MNRLTKRCNRIYIILKIFNVKCYENGDNPRNLKFIYVSVQQQIQIYFD